MKVLSQTSNSQAISSTQNSFMKDISICCNTHQSTGAKRLR